MFVRVYLDNIFVKSGQLIRWDKFLSRFDYHVIHVPGEQNKVTDCLSRYYENDTPDEYHDPKDYVNTDIWLDPRHKDLAKV